MSDFTDAIEATLEREDIEAPSPGVVDFCEECQRNHSYALANPDVGDEGRFSWRACESCGSTFGGNRYAAHAFERGRKPSAITCHHLDICTDCLLFHANGDEPDHDWRQDP